MLETYEDYISLIENETMKLGLSDFRLAREEFHNLTGKFEDGESWFELRMMMFLDWCLLDRRGSDGLTPVERFLTKRLDELNPDERAQMEHLTVTLRSVFKLLETKDSWLLLEDMVRGGRWRVDSMMPTVGLTKGNILNARVVFFDGRPTIGRGMVLHPPEAHQTIEEIISRARAEEFSPRLLVDHLDKMRLKLDRYSNVRIQHVYRYPSDALF